MSERNEILTLIDEEGTKTSFFVLDYFNIDEQEYTVLLPVNEQRLVELLEDMDEDIVEEGKYEDLFTEGEEEAEEGEAIILQVVKGNNGEDTLQTIDDEEEWKKVMEIAYERLFADGEE